jgi:hypothetical protein
VSEGCKTITTVLLPELNPGLKVIICSGIYTPVKFRERGGGEEKKKRLMQLAWTKLGTLASDL